MRNRATLVWLPVEHTFGWVTQLGAYFSTVVYTKGGIEYEVLMDNNEFEFKEGPIDYDDGD